MLQNIFLLFFIRCIWLGQQQQHFQFQTIVNHCRFFFLLFSSLFFLLLCRNLLIAMSLLVEERSKKNNKNDETSVEDIFLFVSVFSVFFIKKKFSAHSRCATIKAAATIRIEFRSWGGKKIFSHFFFIQFHLQLTREEKNYKNIKNVNDFS